VLLGAAATVGRHLSGYRLAPAIAARLRVLTPKEYLILQAIARRILATDGPDAPTADQAEVALFADGYLARLDPGLRSDLRALIQLFEHSAALLGSRFTHMDPATQDRVLADWQSSRLAVRRQGLQALRSLCFFGYYRDERSWPLLGYTGPLLPKKA
jgi:hypothetical protein